MTLHEHTSRAGARLAAAGIPAPEADLDAQLLAARVLGWDRTGLIASWRDPAPPHFPPVFEGLIARREQREPISQILGVREFWGLEFEVTRSTGQLEVRLGDQPRFAVYAESETKFFFEVVDAQITFVLNEEGRAVSLILHQGGRDQEAKRME